MNNELAVKLIDSVSSVLIGKRDAAEMAVTALLAKGHLLIEDVPGVGKTTLALAVAASSGCDFGRIQFTPDTMPSDVFGVSVYNSREGQFEYKAGAIMKNVILADEINRTPPKTQSALLEAMEEGQVTVDGKTYPLPKPFFVVATQNPIEQAGTYILPEAQLDRFMMRISIGYPDFDDEIDMVCSAAQGLLRRDPPSVIDNATLLSMQEEVSRVSLCRDVAAYISELVEATRKSEELLLGASPRASIAIARAAQARAYIEGRDYVRPDDVKKIFVPALAHRVMLSAKARAAGHTAEQVVMRIRMGITVPVV